mmetsp:Transcript_8987/g.11037  ORF Transcript_8987/g.11037 Transcript_8987/m.11037 type:complete len:207 (+) Transcript_8987:61-681(+)
MDECICTKYQCLFSFNLTITACPFYLSLMGLSIGYLTFTHLYIFLHHFSYKRVKACCRRPAQVLLRLCRIAKQQVNLCRTEITWINLYQFTTFITCIYTNLINGSGRSLPRNSNPDVFEGILYKFPHTMSLTSGQNVIVRSIMLHHTPHSLHVVSCVSPITLGVDISKEKSFGEPQMDARDRRRDLTCDKSLSTAGGLVVEEDSVC